MNTNGVRSVWCAALLVVATLLATANARQMMPSPNALKTSLLELVDSPGKVRASLGFIDADQAPSLIMMDSNGVRRLQVGLSFEGSPFVDLADEAGKLGITLSYYSPVVMTAGGTHPGDAKISIAKRGNSTLLNLTTDTIDGKDFGRISLADSSNAEFFCKPPRR
jgi:hypothetical protein